MIAPLAALSSFRRILVPSLALALAPAAVAGNVHTVGGTGGDFADIQSAVTASIDGDVVLVRPGSYSGFTIANKALAVAADTGAVVEITSQVMVQGVGVGKQVVLAGLNLVALPENVYYCLYLNANSGSVRVQACQLGRANMRRGTAAYSRLCNDVAFSGCTLQGANGYGVDPLTGFHYGGGGGGAGLYATGGQVALYDCDLVGGLGEAGEDRLGIHGGTGGTGCLLDQGAVLFASGTTFRGRNGGNGSSAYDCFDNPAGDGGDGGDGIGSPTTVHVTLLDCPVSAGGPGAGGTDACGSGGSPGTAGVPIHLGGSSTFDLLMLGARRLVMPSPVRESTPVHVTLTGEPGEMAYLTMWAGARFLYSPAMSGVLLEKAPLIRRVRLGVVPANGVLDTNVVLPDLGPGVQGKTYFFQAYFLDPANVVTLGSPAFVVALDSAF